MLAGLVGVMALDRLALDVVIRGLHGRQRGSRRGGSSKGTAKGAQQNAEKKPFHRPYFRVNCPPFIAIFPAKRQ